MIPRKAQRLSWSGDSGLLRVLGRRFCLLAVCFSALVFVGWEFIQKWQKACSSRSLKSNSSASTVQLALPSIALDLSRQQANKAPNYSVNYVMDRKGWHFQSVIISSGVSMHSSHSEVRNEQTSFWFLFLFRELGFGNRKLELSGFSG